MPTHETASGWDVLRMETLSWLNIAVAGVVAGAAWLLASPGWAFWTAIVVAGVVVALELFDEWAERHGMAGEVVGPESVVLLGGLWLSATTLLVGGSPAFLAVAFAGGLVIALASGLNLVSAWRMAANAAPPRPR